MTQSNPFDFDKNKSLPVGDYEIKTRQLVPGYEAIIQYHACRFAAETGGTS